MDGLGDLFGSLGEMFGGLVEFGADRAGEAMIEGTVGAFVGGGAEGDATATVGRVLAGRKRDLNVNDR
jgi:hypothetical protein